MEAKVGETTVVVTEVNFQAFAPVITAVRLSQRGLKVIPSLLFQLPNLERLDLSRNNISEVPEAIRRLTKLKVLDLSYNDLKDFPPIPQRLEKLFVAHNQIPSTPDLSESHIVVLDIEGCGVQHRGRFPENIRVIS
ncbi:MAG: leucine-rich repeat domain-containing protein [Chlamydiia bacterium]|nr:leucine-rich repeat domain-containing protein [Chlamydiia bacterium]